MDDEDRVSGSRNPAEGEEVRGLSYWLDACEEISCILTDDIVDFGPASAVPESVAVADTSNHDPSSDPCLFQGFNWMLDVLPACQNSVYPNGSLGKLDSASHNEFGKTHNMMSNTATKHHEINNSGNFKKPLGHPPERNGVRKLETGAIGYDGHGSEGRFNKRIRTSDYYYKNERHLPSRGQYHHGREREGERPLGRKRPRDLEDIDRRDRDPIKRNERYGSGKDCRDREWRESSRGYWERDGLGSNEVVFRLGNWEAERNKAGKSPPQEAEKDQDCNAKVEKKPQEAKEKLPEEQARRYQLEVLQQAKQKNTIAFLETGAGKTLIAVLLIRSVCSDLQRENKKMLAVFLVPKVPLVYQSGCSCAKFFIFLFSEGLFKTYVYSLLFSWCPYCANSMLSAEYFGDIFLLKTESDAIVFLVNMQQAEVIREQTSYQVGHYCGEMGQDFWDARRWQREFETKQVLVMTAQILLNILRHSIIKMEAINLLILDECHHAVKKHPYSLVMSEFYHTTPKDKRPSVFGMTASPVNLKGVSSQVDCAIKIRNLETKLDAVVCTIKDRKELEKHVPMPSEIVVEYDKAASLWSLHEQIKQMELAVEEAAQSSCRRSKWQFMGARDAGAKEELRQVYGVSERTESDGAANLIQKLRAINYALGELGQWCAYKVAQSFLTALQNDERANYQLDVKFQESYLSKVVTLLQCQLSEGAVSENNLKRAAADHGVTREASDLEIEEGELPDSFGELFYPLFYQVE
ncbi:hypothetical protein C3L33_07834, partial [Rhododendron williamsianum]